MQCVRLLRTITYIQCLKITNWILTLTVITIMFYAKQISNISTIFTPKMAMIVIFNSNGIFRNWNHVKRTFARIFVKIRPFWVIFKHCDHFHFLTVMTTNSISKRMEINEWAVVLSMALWANRRIIILGMHTLLLKL